jgi:[ribosomal protein S18]-alanine N-acetyltransferase
MIKEINIDNINTMENISNDFTSSEHIKEDVLNNPFSKYIIYIDNNVVMGFTNYLIAYEKCEIVNIEVKLEFRNKGIGNKLLNYVINKAIENNCDNITLEVRISNNSAISLYKKNGFIEKAIRKDYYKDEDGILMEKKLVI